MIVDANPLPPAVIDDNGFQEYHTATNLPSSSWPAEPSWPSPPTWAKKTPQVNTPVSTWGTI